MSPGIDSPASNEALRNRFLGSFNIYKLGLSYTTSDRLHARGLQCFKLNGNHTEKDRYWQKNNFLLYAKCLKMCSFFAFAFKVCKKCYYDPKIYFLEKYHYRYQKNAEFYADFKFVDADLNKCS